MGHENTNRPRMTPQLRAVRDADLRVIWTNLRDPEASWMAAFGTRDASFEAFAERWQKNASEGTTLSRSIVVDGTVVGFVARFLRDGRPEVTYWVAREHWGQGIATAALRALLELERTRPLYASAAQDNARSLRVLTACGFVVTGSERAFADARGEEIDEVFLEIRGSD